MQAGESCLPISTAASNVGTDTGSVPICLRLLEPRWTHGMLAWSAAQLLRPRPARLTAFDRKFHPAGRRTFAGCARGEHQRVIGRRELIVLAHDAGETQGVLSGMCRQRKRACSQVPGAAMARLGCARGATHALPSLRPATFSMKERLTLAASLRSKEKLVSMGTLRFLTSWRDEVSRSRQRTCAWTAWVRVGPWAPASFGFVAAAKVAETLRSAPISTEQLALPLQVPPQPANVEFSAIPQPSAIS
jgi:hypothetical protein